MANVTLTIGGRAFTLACADGEEAHVARLGRQIDARVAAAGITGQSEARMLLFAALMLADELHETQAREAQQGSTAPDAELAAALANLAERIENLAERLEAGATSA